MANDVTLSFGATSITLSYITPETIHPTRIKNMTEHVLEDGSVAIDQAENFKRLWQFEIEVPLIVSDLAKLVTLYDTNNAITLVENWVDPGTYNAWFKNYQPRFVNASGNTRVQLILQEL